MAKLRLDPRLRRQVNDILQPRGRQVQDVVRLALLFVARHGRMPLELEAFAAYDTVPDKTIRNRLEFPHPMVNEPFNDSEK